MVHDDMTTTDFVDSASMITIFAMIRFAMVYDDMITTDFADSMSMIMIFAMI